jgi:hypothetical protein
MRAAEFMRALADIIDKLDGDDADAQQSVDPSKPLENPVFVSPLQQELELNKADQGKDSPVIDKITADDDIGQEPKKQLFRR